MSMGNNVVVISPHGRKLESIISGALQPGIVVQIQAATEPVNGRHTYEAYNRTGVGAGGAPWPIIVLDIDSYQGKTRDDAYATATRAFMWGPVPCDEFNMIIANISGTTDDYAIGDPLQVVDGTGKLQDAHGGTAQYLSLPFVLLETVTDPTADYFAHVMFTGY